MSLRRTRCRRRRSALRVFMRAFAAALAGAAVLAVLGVGAASIIVSSWLQDLPDTDSTEAFRVAEATEVYSADGQLLARLYLENRTALPLSQIGTALPDAVVAVEDERFYAHDGVDFQGIVRAVLVNLRKGETLEGASTITQQYVRNTVLAAEKTDISLGRKAREACLAMELERRKSKDEILELYLNTIYFGEGAYGAQTAARTYFSKDASALTLPEAALIAGLAQQPTRLSPVKHPDAALARRAVVLERMLLNGYITQQEHDEAVSAPLGLRLEPHDDNGIVAAPYFVAHVKKLLQEEYGSSLVFEGGLTVYTTLDTRMQSIAEDAVFSSLDREGDPDAALVSIDPRNGHIKAMVGGEDYASNKFNLATQGHRQPGSSFKAFVLVAALEAGVSPSEYLSSASPVEIPTKPEVWEVSNSEGRGRGRISLESATRSSVNTVFARLIWALNDEQSTGAEKVADVARRMGIETEIPPYPSIALGSQNVSPLEMASAFGTLAASGQHAAPLAITKVVDRHGDVLLETRPETHQALAPEIAYAATDVLRGVITRGTARRADIDRPAAGKTGTSQDYRDAWFVGYTPDLVTSVWVGHYKEEISMRNVHGMRGFGGTLAAPIWARFMREALAETPAADFEEFDPPEYTRKLRDVGATRARQAAAPPEEPAPEAAAMPEPTPQPVSAPKQATQPVPAAEPQPEPAPEPEPVPAPTPEPEPDPPPTPEPEPDPPPPPEPVP